jgi:molecular chaperone DnaJ
MNWHPDRNPDPGAGEHFARLAAACNYLLEQAGHHKHAASEKSEKTDEESGHSKARGKDREQDIELELELLCRGGNSEVVIETRGKCPSCAGRGYNETTHGQLCARCHGSGRIHRGKALERCPDCDGNGYTHRLRCAACDGKGEQVVRRVLTVNIPPGLLPGDELRLKGEGHPAATPKGHPGDLRLRIRLKPHPLFVLDGSDVVLDRPVSAFVLLAGGTVTIPSPSGLRHLELAPGTASTREISIAGAGVPARGSRVAGTLKVRLSPCLPTVASPALLKLYRALQTEIDNKGQACIPELSDWEARWL